VCVEDDEVGVEGNSLAQSLGTSLLATESGATTGTSGGLLLRGGRVRTAFNERIDKSVDGVDIGDHVDAKTSPTRRVGRDWTNTRDDLGERVDPECRNPVVDR
jgi:hypothetical protein